MNKHLLYFVAVLLLPASLHASEWMGISSATAVPVQVNLVSSGEHETVLHMQLQGYKQTILETPHGKELKITAPGAASILQAGAPDLPKTTAAIIIPDRAKMKVEVLSSSFTEVSGISIAPSKGSLYRSLDPDNIPYTYGEAYGKDEFFPGSLASLQEPFIVRDFRGQSVWFYPFQYNPVTRVLRVYSEISIRISEENQNGENSLVRSAPLTSIDKEYAHIYSSLFKNSSNVISYVPLSEEGEMLIISPSSYLNALTPFMEWKARRGVRCQIVDVATIGNNATSIKNYIQNYYTTHNLKYVLLVGDDGDVATPSMSGGASDPSYGFLVGSDSYAEVMVGRFSAQSLADVETQVQRTVEYESNPTPGGTWYKKATGIASDLGPGNDGEMDWEHERNIRNDMLAFGYSDVDELYDGSHGIGDSNGDPSSNDLITAINDGRSVINYTGHGSQNSCATTGFSSSDVPALTNAGMLPFWWSVGCVHGEFNNGTCIAEVLLRSQNNGQPTGMVATFMSSINQYWDEPMDAQDEFDSVLTECYANNIKRTYGGISINGCMKMNDTYASTGYDMTNTWHIFGDPSLMIRNNVPFAVTASFPAVVPVGTSQLVVGCNTNGALITLTKNMDILGSGLVQGNTVTLTFPPITGIDTFTVTATAFNGIPYTAQLLVIPASGPFVVYSVSTLHDPAGNSDGLADYDEAIQLDVELNNVGLADATGVTAVLSTSDPYINITSASAAYGTITAGNTLNFSNAFAYTIANNIPDQHLVHFDITVSDGLGNTWISPLQQVVNAPLMEIESLVINDASGNNNGFLDPGETADIVITTANNGHSASPTVNGNLSSLSLYVTINAGTSSMGSINPSSSYVSTLNVSLLPNITFGSVYDLTFDVSAAAYPTGQTFLLSAGEILEDFETNNFQKFNWTFGGNANWTTTAAAPFQGTYCAQSGVIGGNASSDLLLQVNVLTDDSISFYKKVSSEAGYDFLQFSIDGIMRNEWSGNEPWSYNAYLMTSGTHLLKWSYVKDGFQIGGMDACWLDNIQLPPIVLPTAVDEIKPGTTLNVYPNPVQGTASLNISLDRPEKVSIRLYNAQGALVKVISDGVQLNGGAQTIRFSTDKLAKGMYVLQVIAGDKTQFIRLLK